MHAQWTGVAASESVPLKFSRGEVPNRQLRKAQPAMRALVQRCWWQSARDRPSFPELVEALTQMEAEAIVGLE